MKINRNSWHYKLVNDYSNKPARSLCQYFWKLVGKLSFIIVFIGGTIFGLIVMPIMGFMEVEGFNPITGFGAWYGILLITIIFGLSNGVKWLSCREPKEPGLLRSYYQAVKSKVCPMIEYYDDN